MQERSEWIHPLGEDHRQKFESIVKRYDLSLEATSALETLILEFGKEAWDRGAEAASYEY